MDITYHKVEKYFEIMVDTNRTKYYPETKTVVVIMGVSAYTYTFEEYFDEIDITALSVEEFDALDVIFNLIDYD